MWKLSKIVVKGEITNEDVQRVIETVETSKQDRRWVVNAWNKCITSWFPDPESAEQETLEFTKSLKEYLPDMNFHAEGRHVQMGDEDEGSVFGKFDSYLAIIYFNKLLKHYIKQK